MTDKDVANLAWEWSQGVGLGVASSVSAAVRRVPRVPKLLICSHDGRRVHNPSPLPLLFASFFLYVYVFFIWLLRFPFPHGPTSLNNRAHPRCDCPI